MTISSDDIEDRIADDLRDLARGLLPLEAAVELIATACDGQLLGGPWTASDNHGGLWFDPDVAAAEKGVLSGGERRVLEVAMSLASSEHPVDLSDVICGLDPDALDHVLSALAHAAGRGPPLLMTHEVTPHRPARAERGPPRRPRPLFEKTPAARPGELGIDVETSSAAAPDEAEGHPFAPAPGGTDNTN